jgi:capsular exopolysaccharide synthesis family protein
MDAQRMMGIVVRRRRIIGISMLCIFGGTALACVFLPDKYEAVSTIVVNNKTILDPIVSKLAVAPDIHEEINTLSKQVMGWARLEGMVQQLHLADHITDPKELFTYLVDLHKRMKVEMKGEDLLEISFSDSSAARAQKVVNALTQNFISENSRMKKEEAQDAIAFIESQLKIYQQKLESSQKNFSTSKIATQMRENFNKRQLLQDRLRNLEKIVPSQIKWEQNPVIGRLQTRLSDVESEIARLSMDAKEGNPKIIDLKKQKQQIKDFLETEKEKETVKESVSVMNPSYLQSEQDLKQLDIEMEDLARRKKEMDGRNELARTPVTEDELANLERSKTVDEDVYQVLLRQLESAYVSEHLQDSGKGSRFLVMEFARLPLTPVGPKRIPMLFMGLFGGLGVGLGLALFVEQIDKSFKTIDEAKDTLSMEYLGVVSKIVPEESLVRNFRMSIKQALAKYMNRHHIFDHIRLVAPTPLKKTSSLPIATEVITVHQPQTMIMEEFRVIKSNIENFLPAGDSSVLAVTSSLKSEGKSTTAANLAVTMALSMKKTLLIDADLRRGRVHELFGISQMPGLTDVINKTRYLDQALVATGVENLTVLPRGTASHKTVDLIGSHRMKEIIAKLKEKYEVIIFDTPPVLSLPDTPLLSKLVDGVVLVVQAERAQARDVLNAQETLGQSSANILGYVLSNVQYYIPRSLYQYYYYGTPD